MAKYITRREFHIHFDAINKALALQAREYERRLLDLNGEREENRRNWSSSVRKDTFEQYQRTMDEKVQQFQQKEDQRTGRVMLYRALAGAGAAGLVIQVLEWFRS